MVRIETRVLSGVVCAWAVACGSTVEGRPGGPDGGAGVSANGGAAANAGNGGAGAVTNTGATAASSGGASAGATGAGGTLGAGGAGTGGALTELAACRKYLEKACARVAECSGRPADACLQYENQCPDFFFSPGANRQPGELAACADTWASFDCGSVVGGAAPPCAIRGSVQDNQPCRFGSQCHSLLCASSVNCSTCVPEVASGAPCDSSVVCPPNEACVSSACAAPTPVTEPAPAPPAAAGATCTTSCVAGYACLGGTCMPAPGPGESCNDVCAPPASCVPDSTGQLRCALVGQEGAPCAPANPECIPGATCMNGTCVANGLQGMFATACGM